MADFELSKWIPENQRLFSSTQLEDLLTPRIDKTSPRTLEDIGIRPQSVLGEGDYKNYVHWRNDLRNSLPGAGGGGGAKLPPINTGH